MKGKDRIMNKDVMIWTTFDVRTYIEHIKLPNYSQDLRQHLHKNLWLFKHLQLLWPLELF